MKKNILMKRYVPWADTCPGLPKMYRAGRKDFLSVGSGTLLIPMGMDRVTDIIWTRWASGSPEGL